MRGFLIRDFAHTFVWIEIDAWNEVREETSAERKGAEGWAENGVESGRSDGGLWWPAGNRSRKLHYATEAVNICTVLDAGDSQTSLLFRWKLRNDVEKDVKMCICCFKSKTVGYSWVLTVNSDLCQSEVSNKRVINAIIKNIDPV